MSNSQCVEVRIPLPCGFITGCWYGDRSRRPILALHGWQNNAGSFARLAPLLSDAHCGVSILAIDLPGHGRSSHFPAGIRYHMLDYVRVIGHVRRHYKWAQLSLMGHSMGACVCFVYAALFPQQVDTMIALDMIKTRYFPVAVQLKILEYATEKQLEEDERLLRLQLSGEDEEEPPLFTYAKLEKLMHMGSEYSIDEAQSKHLLTRCIKPSALVANKFHFTFDRRIKNMFEFATEPAFALELAQRIRNINYLVIKSGKSYHLNDEADQVLAVLRQNNPNFEYYELPNGKHHVHLNDAEDVAAKIMPFLRKYRSQLEPLNYLTMGKL